MECRRYNNSAKQFINNTVNIIQLVHYNIIQNQLERETMGGLVD